jgi:hypothetical protein
MQNKMLILIIQQTAFLLQELQDHMGHDCNHSVIAHLTLHILGYMSSCGGRSSPRQALHYVGTETNTVSVSTNLFTVHCEC